MSQASKMIRALVASAAAFGAMQSTTAAEVDLIDLSNYNLCHTFGTGATVCSDTGSDPVSGSGTFPAFAGTSGGQPDTFFMYNTTGAIESGNKIGNGTNQNKDIVLGNFSVTQYGGKDVFTFILDINQVNKSTNPKKPVIDDPDSLLSVNHVALFAGPAGNLTGFDPAAGGGAGSLGAIAPVWYMDVTSYIKLNYALAGGSGRPDMYLYIPVSVFENAGFFGSSHIQLYSRFGENWINNDGFEEWSYLSCYDKKGQAIGDCYDPDEPPPPPDVPEPGTLALLGMGLLGLGLSRRRAAASRAS